MKLLAPVRLILLGLMLFFGATAQAQTAHCDDVAYLTIDETTCAVSWLYNDRIFILNWEQSSEIDELSVETVGQFIQVRSPNVPSLQDIDHDGFVDLSFFVLNGMVNGSFTFMRFDPEIEEFQDMGIGTGHSFSLDISGSIVLIGRSSCCEIWAEVFDLVDGQLRLAMVIDIRPVELSDPTTQCVVHGEGLYTQIGNVETGALTPAHTEIIAAYCQIYEDEGTVLVSRRDQQDASFPDGPFVLGRNTEFFCLLEDGQNSVAITRDGDGWTYAFGGVGAEPALQLFHADLAGQTEGPLEPDGSLLFHNEPYTYAMQGLLDSTAEGTYRLTARLEDHDDNVFDRACLAGAVYHPANAFRAAP